MTVKTGSSWAGTFVTLDSTGALAAGSPSGVLYIDGVADAATVTITGSNPYKWSVTLPSLTAGQRCDMYITATIATIATAGVVASEQADTVLASDVKAETAAILADTGTDGVKIASGELSTVATASSITALDGKIDTIDNFLDTEIADILADTNELQAELADGGRTDLLIDAIKTKTDVIPASPAPANEYDARMTAIQADLDNPNQYKADVSGLATQTSVNAIPTSPLLAANYVAPDNASIGAIKTKTDQLVFTTPNKVDASATIDPTGLATSAALATVDGIVDSIKAKTDQLTFTTANKVDATASATLDATALSTISGDVWSHANRTLTNQGISTTTPATGDPLVIYRDTTVNISLTGLGAMDGYTKIWFTVKEDLEDLDTDAILQVEVTDGLKYLDGAAGVDSDGTLTIGTTTADVEIKQASAALLPVYAAYPVPWDLKMLKDSNVTILAQGTIYINSTPTRAIA